MEFYPVPDYRATRSETFWRLADRSILVGADELPVHSQVLAGECAVLASMLDAMLEEDDEAPASNRQRSTAAAMNANSPSSSTVGQLLPGTQHLSDSMVMREPFQQYSLDQVRLFLWAVYRGSASSGTAAAEKLDRPLSWAVLSGALRLADQLDAAGVACNLDSMAAAQVQWTVRHVADVLPPLLAAEQVSHVATTFYRTCLAHAAHVLLSSVPEIGRPEPPAHRLPSAQALLADPRLASLSPTTLVDLMATFAANVQCAANSCRSPPCEGAIRRWMNPATNLDVFTLSIKQHGGVTWMLPLQELLPRSAPPLLLLPELYSPIFVIAGNEWLLQAHLEPPPNMHNAPVLDLQLRLVESPSDQTTYFVVHFAITCGPREQPLSTLQSAPEGIVFSHDNRFSESGVLELGCLPVPSQMHAALAPPQPGVEAAAAASARAELPITVRLTVQELGRDAPFISGCECCMEPRDSE